MTKPQRTCARCNQTDDHPRHCIGVSTASGEQPTNFHMNCHAALGCPVCLHQLKDADGAQGEQLREHLKTLAPLDQATIAELLGQSQEG